MKNFSLFYFLLLKTPIVLFSNKFQMLFLHKIFSFKKIRFINKKNALFCVGKTNAESQYLHDMLNNNTNTFYHDKTSYIEETTAEMDYLHDIINNNTHDKKIWYNDNTDFALTQIFSTIFS